jgi:hypothetical protein
MKIICPLLTADCLLNLGGIRAGGALHTDGCKGQHVVRVNE